MPKLPVETFTRDSELAQKSNWKTGIIGKKKAPVFKKPLFSTNHIRFACALIVVAAILVGIYFAATSISPSFFKKSAKPQQAETEPKFEYPFDINLVKFTSEAARKTFLDNFQKSAGEQDSKARYKLLEENFLTLRGLYISTQSSQYRDNLEKFKTYMEKYFPDEVSQNPAMYSVPCLDLACGTLKIPDEITALKQEIDSNSSIGDFTKVGLDKNFKAAGFSGNKTEQASNYINALSALYSEYGRTKNEKTKATYQKLSDYIKANYAEFPVPKEITL